MSITTAFAAGFNTAFCSSKCTATRRSAYYKSNSRRPLDDLNLRPTVRVSTDDVARNVRAAGYADAKLLLKDSIPIEVIKAPALEAKQNVMFYFIGAKQVSKIGTNRFLPGAVADHLTSVGGDLLGGFTDE